MLNGTFFSWKEAVKIIDSFSYFLQKRKQFSFVNFFWNTQKQNDES